MMAGTSELRLRCPAQSRYVARVRHAWRHSCKRLNSRANCSKTSRPPPAKRWPIPSSMRTRAARWSAQRYLELRAKLDAKGSLSVDVSDGGSFIQPPPDARARLRFANHPVDRGAAHDRHVGGHARAYDVLSEKMMHVIARRWDFASTSRKCRVGHPATRRRDCVVTYSSSRPLTIAALPLVLSACNGNDGLGSAPGLPLPSQPRAGAPLAPAGSPLARG